MASSDADMTDLRGTNEALLALHSLNDHVSIQGISGIHRKLLSGFRIALVELRGWSEQVDRVYLLKIVTPYVSRLSF